MTVTPLWGIEARAVVSHRNITDRRHAEDEARRRGEQLSITLDSIGDGVLVTDEHACVTRLNATAERLTGWMLEDAVGHPLAEVFRIVNARTRQPSADPARRAIDMGTIVGLANHTTLIAKDGREYQIADSAAPIREPDGRIIGVIVVFSDVSEDYRIRRELEATSRLLEHAASVAKVGGWELDLATGEQRWSLETYSIFGLDPGAWPTDEQGLGFVDPADRVELIERVRQAVAADEPWDLEVRATDAAGERLWLRFRGRPVTEDGRPMHLFGAFQDITDRKDALP